MLNLPIFGVAPGGIAIGLPLAAGGAPGACYAGIYFIDDNDRTQFIADVCGDLQRLAPHLFAEAKL